MRTLNFILQMGRTLNFLVRTTYSVVLRVRDSQGGQAQTTVTVNVLEVNKPPYFASELRLMIAMSCALRTSVPALLVGSCKLLLSRARMPCASDCYTTVQCGSSD